MARIDYGVLIKKNKKIIAEHDDYIDFDNGVRVLFLRLAIIIGKNKEDHWSKENTYLRNLESDTVKYPYKKYRMKYSAYGVNINSKRIDEGGRYYTIIQYKDDLYEVIHGYGIDENFDLIYDENSKIMNKLNRFMKDVL